MPNSVDEKHSPSEFYYPGETNYEQNSNKNSQEKVSGLFYKVRKIAIQQSHIINPLLTSFARSVRESLPSVFIAQKTSGNTFPYRPRTRLTSP